MKQLTIWRIEEWDGGDRTIPNGNYFSNKKAADEYKKNNKYNCCIEQTIRIYDSLKDMEDNSKQKLKERALAKLTEEERKILGL